MADLRVLQVLADTDDVDDSRFSLDLHAALATGGLEVRTMALGPGRVGGLESVVPVMSPSRRSIAAHTQLRREQRWADVVLLRGEAPASVAGLAFIGGGPPIVVALGEEARRWTDGPVPSRIRRLVDRGATVVVTDDASAAVAGPLGLASEAVHVVPFGVALPSPPTTPAQRTAARSMLGLPAGAPVARVLGPRRSGGAATARHAASRAGIAVVDDDAGDPEVVTAAADIAVSADQHWSGPSRELLLAGRDGSALVAPSVGATAHLVDDTTGVSAGPDADSLADALERLGAEPDQCRTRGAAAAARVRARYDLAAVAGRWADLLEVASRVDASSAGG